MRPRGRVATGGVSWPRQHEETAVDVEQVSFADARAAHPAARKPAHGSAGVRARFLLLTPLVVFAISHVLMAALAWYAPHLLPDPGIRANASVLPHSDWLSGAGRWTAPWFRFDTAWYVGVAEHGYHWGALGRANTNFMPLYPALIRVTQLVTGSAWFAAWLIANLAYLAALVVLWQWASYRFAVEVATRTLLLLVAFPFAFFFATPYAEPLFLLLAVAAFVLAEKERWWLAIVAAGLSTVTRPVGLAVVLGLVVLALARNDRRHAMASFLALLPLGGFIVYLGVAFGRPLAFLTYHSGGWIPPHGGLLTTISSQFHTHFSPFDRIDAFLVVVFLASSVLAWRRLGPHYGVYIVVGVLLPLVHGLVSMERYVIVLFPAMAAWATIENKGVQIALFAISSFGFLVATTMFTVGYTLI